MSRTLFVIFGIIVGITTYLLTISVAKLGLNIWIFYTLCILVILGLSFAYSFATKAEDSKKDALHKAHSQINLESKEKELFEEALLRNENKFKNFISNSPDGIVLTDESGIITEWNPALAGITGIDRNDALGMYYWDIRVSLFSKINSETLNSADHYDLIDESITATHNTNTLRETDILSKTGNSKIVQIKTFSLPSNSGFKIASIIRDVTEIKQKDKEIRKSAEQLRAIFENTHQAFIFLDPNSLIIDNNAIANTRAVEIFDQPLEKGISLNEYFKKFNDFDLKLYLLAAKNGENVQTELNLKHSGEKEHWYEFHLAPVFNDDMYVIGIFLNFFDIQIRKNSENEMRNALVTERELNKLKSQFVSSVSHEFRTPLASIYSNTQMLDKYNDKWDSSKREATFSRIYQSIAHMTALLQDVSLLGKGQSGMQRFEPEMMDIVQICEQIIEETESNFEQKNRIHFSTSLKNFDALIDINLTKHIFINLLNNALKYSPTTESVLFSLIFEEPNLLIFTIKDKGIGIKEVDLKNIFEPFIRGTNVGSIVGTGLGMAIVKQCVDVHNGEIAIKSEVGQGTTVTVRLPYKIAKNEPI